MIYISDIRMHAYHGVLPQEREVGNDYVINVAVDYPIETACLSDRVEDTMSYADVAEIIKKEMAVQSNLLEHVAHRICTAILLAFPKATQVEIDLKKIAPPMPICCSGAGVKLSLKQNNSF